MMCLDVVYKGNQKKEALAKLPESGYYWKTVRHYGNVYYPICFSLPDRGPFKAGWNQTPRKYIGHRYNVAFHFHRTKKVAQVAWLGTHIRCVIKKKDIVAIGTQSAAGCHRLTIVTKRFWMPKPKKKKV